MKFRLNNRFTFSVLRNDDQNICLLTDSFFCFAHLQKAPSAYSQYLFCCSSDLRKVQSYLLTCSCRWIPNEFLYAYIRIKFISGMKKNNWKLSELYLYSYTDNIRHNLFMPLPLFTFCVTWFLRTRNSLISNIHIEIRNQ